MAGSDIILNLQKILVAIFGISLAALIGIIFLTDPYSSQLYFWAFLGSIFVFLTSTFALIGFWFAFNRRYLDLSNVRVLSIIKQSIVAGSLITVLIFLQSIRQLNLLSLSLILTGYILYEMWSI